MGKKAEIFWLAANQYLSHIGDNEVTKAYKEGRYPQNKRQHCCGALIAACRDVTGAWNSTYFENEIKPWLNKHFGSYLNPNDQFTGGNAETQQQRYAYLMLAYEIAEELDE